MVPTDAQAALIDRISTALQADVRVRSGWLVGSLGRGNGDAFSDVDVMLVVPNDAFDVVSKTYAADLSAIAPTMLINPLFGRVLNVVTDDWSRFDLTFMRPAGGAGLDNAAVQSRRRQAGCGAARTMSALVDIPD